MLESQRILNHSSIALRNIEVNVTRLILVGSLKNPAYAHLDGEFIQVLRADESIGPDYIRNHASTHGVSIFISKEDAETLDQKLHDQLIKLTRSLSIGDRVKNGTRQTNLLSLQMANLYDNPFDDKLLQTQFQSTKNFYQLLKKCKPHQHKKIFQHMWNTPHYYTIAQPMLSSLLLVAFLEHTKMLSDREVENLFLASYFKDIGMSFIPREKFEQADLTSDEKQLFEEHAKNSMKILEGRIPLNRNYLTLIEHHHFLNHKIRAKIQGLEVPRSDVLHGIESTLLASIDIFVAMISKRPYRDPTSVFDAMDLIKKVFADEYPQEFKQLVLFIKQFFKK
jgi:response regulator RpfG family c-di-GMP phosphodiesterase